MARDKLNNEINAGSMADIAFLLLIFFLVTTTIDVDKGVLVKLPPWSEEDPETLTLKKRNVFSVLVNADNALLVRGEPADVDELRERARGTKAPPKVYGDFRSDVEVIASDVEDDIDWLNDE